MEKVKNDTLRRSLIPAFYRDIRFLQIIGQLVFVFVIVVLLAELWTSIMSSLEAKNLTPNLAFLQNRAGFDISEHPAWYSSDGSYGEAFTVGLMNSLRIIVLGVVLSTIIGIIGGIFLLSGNWLIRTITQVIVEFLRNIPLLVQLVFWYSVVIFSLPEFKSALTFPSEGVYFLPLLRWAVYVAAYFTLWSYGLKAALQGSPKRVLLNTLFWCAVIAIEVCFWRVGRTGGVLFNTPVIQMAYLAVSVGLIGLVYLRLRETFRWSVLGLLVGQLIGVLVFLSAKDLLSSAVRLEVFPALFVSKRGVAFFELLPTAHFGTWAAFFAFGVGLAALAWTYFGHVTETIGRPIPRLTYCLAIVVGFALVGWWSALAQPTPSQLAITNADGQTVLMTAQEAQDAGLLTEEGRLQTTQEPLLYIPPAQKISKAGVISGFVSGTEVTPEYIGLLLGLVIYTAAFIAEIVRAGILAVPRGQIEAARALGLNGGQMLRLVILPQAMRVIIPPLGSQFLNLSKNSSLAIAVAYADVLMVTQTIMNQSGQSVTGIALIMVTYLVISLVFSFFTNLVNRRFQLVTR